MSHKFVLFDVPAFALFDLRFDVRGYLQSKWDLFLDFTGKILWSFYKFE